MFEGNFLFLQRALELLDDDLGGVLGSVREVNQGVDSPRRAIYVGTESLARRQSSLQNTDEREKK